MPSEKRVNKKKSHRRKGKKYSRSSERKEEGKKCRDVKNRGEEQVSEVDICSYVNDSAELVSNLFTCLGEGDISEATPPIFKSLSKIELKKLCLRELAMLSSEAIIEIMHGISPENIESLADHRKSPTHQRTLRESTDTETQKRIPDTEGKETSSDASSRSSFESSPNVASTSSHHALISSHIPVIDDSAQISMAMDPEGRKSEGAQKDVNISDISECIVSPENLLIAKVSEEQKVDENDNRESLPKINVPFLQPVPEVTELEYRVRAIRSMIANIDKINEKSFETNSIQ